MLSVEERFMIKDLHRKGVSLSEIARQTGRDRKTVRKVIQGALSPEGDKAGRRRFAKLAAYEGYLQERRAEGVLNARKLYRELQERGYQGGLTQVIEYLQPFRVRRSEQATLRFETEPGRQAQVDWGSFGYLDQASKRRQLYGFVMTLGWSRAMYAEYTTSADTGMFLRCHQHAFEYFGGVTREVLHDNLKSAVLGRDGAGQIHWNVRYLDFALALGFTPRACQPYRPQTKGKVESGIRYLRGNFWVGLHFEDMADLNRQCLHWLNSVANVRVHGTTGIPPFNRLPDEQLLPLPAQRFDTSLISQRRVSRDCLVSYAGNFYSVPAIYARQTLLVKETEDRQLVILTGDGQPAAQHELLSGAGQRVLDPAHYAGLPAPTAPRPSALAYQQPQPPALSAWDAPLVEVRPLSVYDCFLEESDD